MNKITINSNLVRGRLDTIPTEGEGEGGEGRKTNRNFELLSFPDECSRLVSSKNGIKLTNEFVSRFDLSRRTRFHRNRPRNSLEHLV